MYWQDCFFFSKERTATNIKLLSDTIVKFVDVIISWNGFDNMPVSCVGSLRKEKARITFQIQVGSTWNMGKFCWQEEDKPKDQKNKDRY